VGPWDLSAAPAPAGSKVPPSSSSRRPRRRRSIPTSCSRAPS